MKMESFLVPVRRNPGFDRPGLLSEIERVLTTKGHAIICGAGGTGKTQLAFDFCSQYKTGHPDALIIWIGVETKSHLEERLREIARRISIIDQANISENIVSWLRMNPRGDWMLVLDDVGKEFQPIIAGSNDGMLFPSPTLLFRSLKGNTKTLDAHLTNKLMFTEALVMLPYPTVPTLNDSLKILKQHCPNIPWDTRIAERVAKALEFSPMAISIAAAYMEDGGITFNEYLDIFRQFRETTSTGDLQAYGGVGSPIGWESLLLYDRKQQNARNLYGSLRKLESLSLVQKSIGDYHYSMLRLVRDFFIDYLRNEGKLEIQQQFAVELLSNRYPYGDQSVWNVCRMYNPHAEKAIDYQCSDLWPRAALLMSMGSYDENCGRYATAHARYMKVRKIYMENRPLSEKQEDLMVDVSLREAKMLGHLSKFDAGERLLYDTMQQIKSKVEPGKPQLIHARGLQAWFCSWRGQHAEAERLWRLCLKGTIEIHFETHVESLTYQSNITTALIEQGKYSDAEELLAQKIRGRISVRGNDHPDTIQSQQILAVVYQHQGKYNEAEELNQRILKISDRIQGSEHPDTLTIVNNLSTNLRVLGPFSEAEVMQWRLLASRERQYGLEHEEIVISRINLAVTLEKLGKYSAAEEQNRLALAAQKKLFPFDNHPTTLNIENSLGLVLLRQGNYDDAEPILRKVLERRREVLGIENHQTLISQNNLAGLLMKQKKYGQSKALLEETLKTGRKNNGGADNAFTLRLTNSLSEVMRQGVVEVVETERQRLFLQALELQRTALAGRIMIFGEDHPDVFTSQYNLAHLLHDMGRCIEARKFYEKAAEGLSRTLGKNHPVTIECEENFAVCKSQR